MNGFVVVGLSNHTENKANSLNYKENYAHFQHGSVDVDAQTRPFIMALDFFIGVPATVRHLLYGFIINNIIMYRRAFSCFTQRDFSNNSFCGLRLSVSVKIWVSVCNVLGSGLV